MRCAGRCGSVTRTRCPSCSPCRWTGGSSRTCLGSRARWSGDQEAGAAVAIGGGAGPRGRGADRRGRVADRDEHDRDAGRRAACESAAADPGGAAPGPARRSDRSGTGAAPRAPQPGRRARDRSGQRGTARGAGDPVDRRQALPRRPARLGARAAERSGPRGRPGGAGRRAVTQGVVERGRTAAATRGGRRTGPRDRLVPAGRGLEQGGRPARCARRVRARDRARAPQREGAVRARYRARSAPATRGGDPDVPPLAGGRRQVIRVVVDDLAFLASDAIVRPATTRLDPTTPAVRRLEQVGGPEVTAHIRIQKELAVGAAVVTAGGGDLPAEFVIHAVIRSDTEPVTREGVARAWQSALERAQEWEFGRLTVPPLGTGAGNLAVEDAAEVMVQVLKVHAGSAAFPADVSIVVETPEDREAFEAALQRRGAAES